MKKFFTLLLISVAVFAADINFPELSGRVVDEAGLLKQETKDKLTQILANHENNTTNQVVVVTINSLQDKDIAQYSLELARHWAIGQKGKDNGVLLVIAPNEKEVRIEVGYGLEGSLTDATAHEIIQRVILPKFKEGNLEQGIVEGVLKIIDFIDEDEQNDFVYNKAQDAFFDTVTLMVVGGFALLFIGVIFKFKFLKDFGLASFISAFAGVFSSAFLESIFDTSSPLASFILLGVFFMVIYTKVQKTKAFKRRNLDTSSNESYSSGGYSRGGFSGSRGGGFSGGGGSFGGGGASGRW